jgi:hypothetical protein
MKVVVEIYKGIEFVRISNLPVEQKELISNSNLSRKVIKIMKDETVLHDCLQYRDYLEWYEKYKGTNRVSALNQPVAVQSLTFSTK